jgi:DNA-directed RNA polymerase subunit RPC12/RpoP
MIRYLCPRCRSMLESPEHKAGAKVNCPQCRQRLQVPLPPLNKTILAPLVQPRPVSGHGPSVPGLPPAPSTTPASAIQAQPSPHPQATPLEPPSTAIDPRGPGFLSRFRRGHALLGASVLASVVITAAVGGVAWWGARGLFPAPGSVAEARSDPRTDAEELVKRWVVNNAQDPKAITFKRWGPHMTGRELAELFREAGLDGLVWTEQDRKKWRELAKEADSITIVRVQWDDPHWRPPLPVALAGPGDAPGQPHQDDALFLVYKKLVLPIAFGMNEHGDDWKKDFRREMAKVFPAIDLPEK